MSVKQYNYNDKKNKSFSETYPIQKFEKIPRKYPIRIHELGIGSSHKIGKVVRYAESSYVCYEFLPLSRAEAVYRLDVLSEKNVETETVSSSYSVDDSVIDKKCLDFFG